MKIPDAEEALFQTHNVIEKTEEKRAKKIKESICELINTGILKGIFKVDYKIDSKDKHIIVPIISELKDMGYKVSQATGRYGLYIYIEINWS